MGLPVRNAAIDASLKDAKKALEELAVDMRDAYKRYERLQTLNGPILMGQGDHPQGQMNGAMWEAIEGNYVGLIGLQQTLRLSVKVLDAMSEALAKR